MVHVDWQQRNTIGMLLIGGKEEGEEGPCFIMGVQFVPPTEKKRTFSSSFDLVSSSAFLFFLHLSLLLSSWLGVFNQLVDLAIT